MLFSPCFPYQVETVDIQNTLPSVNMQFYVTSIYRECKKYNYIKLHNTVHIADLLPVAAIVALFSVQYESLFITDELPNLSALIGQFG